MVKLIHPQSHGRVPLRSIPYFLNCAAVRGIIGIGLPLKRNRLESLRPTELLLNVQPKTRHRSFGQNMCNLVLFIPCSESANIHSSRQNMRNLVEIISSKTKKEKRNNNVNTQKCIKTKQSGMHIAGWCI